MIGTFWRETKARIVFDCFIIFHCDTLLKIEKNSQDDHCRAVELTVGLVKFRNFQLNFLQVVPVLFNEDQNKIDNCNGITRLRQKIDLHPQKRVKSEKLPLQIIQI